MISVYVLDREDLEEALDAAGLSDENVREDYGGRGMYGGTCFGLVCDLGELLLFVAALETAGDDGWIGRACSDSMGLSTIWYWPNVSLEEES